MDDVIHELRRQSKATHSLDELKNFLLPPLLSIVFVQECSVDFKKVFDEGRLDWPTFSPDKWSAWVRVCRLKSAILVSCVFLS